MMRPLLTLCLLLCHAVCACAADFNLDSLMQGLAAQGERHARFSEKKYLSLLDQPVSSSGTLAFVPPDRLERDTLQPRPERLIVAGGELRLLRDGSETRLRLAEVPEAAVLIGSLRATLAGDRPALERDYALHLAGKRKHWTLSLLPSDSKVAALVLRVSIQGHEDQVDQVEILQGDGDRSVMQITAGAHP